MEAKLKRLRFEFAIEISGQERLWLCTHRGIKRLSPGPAASRRICLVSPIILNCKHTTLKHSPTLLDEFEPAVLYTLSRPRPGSWSAKIEYGASMFTRISTAAPSPQNLRVATSRSLSNESKTMYLIFDTEFTFAFSSATASFLPAHEIQQATSLTHNCSVQSGTL